MFSSNPSPTHSPLTHHPSIRVFIRVSVHSPILSFRQLSIQPSLHQLTRTHPCTPCLHAQVPLCAAKCSHYAASFNGLFQTRPVSSGDVGQHYQHAAGKCVAFEVSCSFLRSCFFLFAVARLFCSSSVGVVRRRQC